MQMPLIHPSLLPTPSPSLPLSSLPLYTPKYLHMHILHSSDGCNITLFLLLFLFYHLLSVTYIFFLCLILLSCQFDDEPF